MHKKGQSGGFLGRLLGPLLKPGLPLMKNVLKPLAQRVLISLGLIVAALATSVAIDKKISSLLIKGVRKTIKTEAKEEKCEFFSMLLGTLGASLLWNLLTG